MTWLQPVSLSDLENARFDPVEPAAARTATAILDRIRQDGWSAVQDCSERFGDLEPGQATVYRRADLEAALEQITPEQRGILERTAERITTFARTQRSAIRDIDPQNDLTFLRIRSKKHEIMVAPDKEYLLIVIQNPNDGV